MRTGRYFVLLLLLAVCCREKYMPALTTPPTGYLVVEGIINSGDGPTNILLSRTNTITADSLRFENGAVVQVEGNDNSIYNLVGKGSGAYSIDQLHLDNAGQYRLHIKTTDGKDYLSDYVAVKSTPAIDTVFWTYGSDGIDFFVSTHDPQNNTRYYYWDYEETWEFHTSYVATLKWDTQFYGNAMHLAVSPITPDPSLLTCWTNAVSSNILTASSNKLSEDVINNYHLASLQKGSDKLGVQYSILVRQYALTAEAYEFLQRMKKNTEQTGSVFDPQPSQLKGNIHNTNDPADPVLGFVSVCAEQSKRVFIRNNEVPNWNYERVCTLDSVYYSDPPPFKMDYKQALGFKLVPIMLLIKDFEGGFILSCTAASAPCVDCTLTGTNKKPVFWP